MTTSALSSSEEVKTISFTALPSSRDPESAIQREYEWTVEINGSVHTITLFHSKKTGTVKASLDGKQFYTRYIPPNDIYYCYFYAVTGVKGCRMDIIHTPEGVELSINEKNFTDLFHEQNPGVEISKVRILPEESAIKEEPPKPKTVVSDPIIQQQGSYVGSQQWINSDPSTALQHRQGSSNGSQSALKYSVQLTAQQQTVRPTEPALTSSPVPFQPFPGQVPYGYPMPPPPMLIQNNLPQAPMMGGNPFNQPLPKMQNSEPEIGPSMLYQGPIPNYQPKPIPQEPLVPAGTALVFPDDPIELNELMKKAAAYNNYATIPPAQQQPAVNSYGRGSQESSGGYQPGSQSEIILHPVPQMMPPPAMVPTMQQPSPYTNFPPHTYGFDPILSNPFSPFIAEKLHAIVIQNLMQQDSYGSVPPAGFGSLPPTTYGSEPPINYGQPPQQNYYYGQPQMNYVQPPNYAPPQPPVNPSQPSSRPSSNHSNSGRPNVPEAQKPSPIPSFRYPTPMPQQPPSVQQPPQNYQPLPPINPMAQPMKPSSQKQTPKLNPNPQALQGPQGPQRPPLPKASNNQPSLTGSVERPQLKKNTDSQLSMRLLVENTEEIPRQLSASGMDQIISSTPDLKIMSTSKEPAKQPIAQLRQVESQIYNQ